MTFFFNQGSTALADLGLVIKVSRLHSDTPQSVGLLWTSDRFVAEVATYKPHNKHEAQIPTPRAEFEPTILASEWLQTHALDRVATGIGE